MENEEYIISLKNVNKSFGDTTVVNDISLDIKKGEFVTILGPSGCGKSTTLRMIAGFEVPTSGQILLNGKDITKIPAYLRPINTVFQRYALFPNYDVYDNVAFGLKLKKIPYTITKKSGKVVTKYKKLTAAQIDEEVSKALQIVDLAELENRDITTLSGGQQQRVAIARAIVNRPEILLLDEPLGALDLKMRKDMQLELKAMHEKLGITFIYVTHDQEEALTMSDTIVVMKAGEIQQIGNPTQIYNEPVNAYVANFIGESNIYNATMVGKKKVKFIGHIFSCVDNFPINEKVDVVIRPEDVILKKVNKEVKETTLTGTITSKIFKGMHYEYCVMVGKNELYVQDTKARNVGDLVSIDILAENIQIMEKDSETNTYPEAWINNKNKLVISDVEFDCDVTKVLKGSHLDENGYLVGPDGTLYDLNNADVIAEIGFSDVEASDEEDNGDFSGTIVSMIYKGDHYQVMVRTDEDEDFIFDSQDTWNIGDSIWIKIKKENIALALKGDIRRYVKE